MRKTLFEQIYEDYTATRPSLRNPKYKNGVRFNSRPKKPQKASKPVKMQDKTLIAEAIEHDNHVRSIMKEF